MIRLVLLLFYVYFANLTYSQDYYRINNGNTQQIDKFYPCKIVTNNCGNDIFIPIKTQAEWDAFSSNLPSGVTLSDCNEVNCTPSPECYQIYINDYAPNADGNYYRQVCGMSKYGSLVGTTWTPESCCESRWNFSNSNFGYGVNPYEDGNWPQSSWWTTRNPLVPWISHGPPYNNIINVGVPADFTPSQSHINRIGYVCTPW